MSLLAYGNNGFTTTRAQVDAAPMPAQVGNRTELIPFGVLVDTLADIASRHGLLLGAAEYALSPDGQKCFWFQPTLSELTHGVTLALGGRSSYDNSLAPTFAAGGHVFVCANLEISANIVITAKQTANGLTTLTERLDKGMPTVIATGKTIGEAVQVKRQARLSRVDANQLLMELFRKGIVPGRDVAHVLHEWETPTITAWNQEPHNVWRFENAVTQVAKRWSARLQWSRTQRLNALLSEAVGAPKVETIAL